jgi:hypothetical protein
MQHVDVSRSERWAQLLLENEVDSLGALLHASLGDLKLEGTGKPIPPYVG